MDDWVKRLSVGLVLAFIMGGLAVMASDQEQERRISEVESETKEHNDNIRVLRESKISIEKDISQIKRDVERIAVGVERLNR